MIWYKYQTHDYMDEKPSIGYRLFPNAEYALEWEQYMNASYSGGTTVLLGPAKQEEVLKFVKDNGLKLDSDTLANINNKSYYLNN